LVEPSAWSAKVVGTSTVTGKSAVRFSFGGGLVFNVYLGPTEIHDNDGGVRVVPQHAVAGRMLGTFESDVSTATRHVTGKGNAEWTVAGTYDPSKETVGIVIRSAGIDMTGLDAAVPAPGPGGEPGKEVPGDPFAYRFNWGYQIRFAGWGGELPWTNDIPLILDQTNSPKLPVIPIEREAYLAMVHGLPQTALKDPEPLTVNLRDPEPQTITQTFEDETGWGTRSTTWTLALIPHAEIRRENLAAGGDAHSFVSTDALTFRLAIGGVDVPHSGWAELASWRVKGLSPLSGAGTPDHRENSMTFEFKPNPPPRPAEGSTVRNRPLQYDISATFEGIEQHFIVRQDDADLLRQEYLDHGEAFVPSRSDCVALPMDGALNSGNYNLVVDGGLKTALEKVTAEFRKASQDPIKVVGGFRSPQRNKATGDAHPNNPHTRGRALDLAPEPSTAASLSALQAACRAVGYRAVCESAPGKEVAPESPEAKHVHVDW
jgi:hypothetical protein